LPELPDKLESLDAPAPGEGDNGTSIVIRFRLPRGLDGAQGFYKVHYTPGLQ